MSNNWHKSQLSWALGLGFLTSFYGIVGLIVYYVPDSAFGGAKAYQYKIVTIALVLITLPFALIIGYVVSRRAKKKEEAAKQAEEGKAGKTDKTESAPQKLSAPKGNFDDIYQSAEETVQFLRSSNLGNGKDAVYELPWYLVIGNPKSGKSSLSLASNLNFQTLPSQRQSEQKFIRPTKKIDWRVTSDAVFLDTAGRYQTEAAEADEWTGILETLRKYRGNRPLDGMILTISAERVLNGDEKEIEEVAKILRARIDETLQRLKVWFPIYLVFTHADAIEGFRDSFSNSQREGENLVWGATIPLENSENAHALFDEEFGLLQNSVMKRRLMRLSAPFPPVRQLKIFNFPLHFGSARKKLGHFVTTLFRPNPFSQNPFLRGFYFTAVPVNRSKADGGQTMTNAGQTIGSTYFTQKLFRDVILRDKDLVSTFQSQKVGPPIMGWLLTFLGAVLTLFLLAMSANSLRLNRTLVTEATKSGEDVLALIGNDDNRNPLTKTPEDTKTEIGTIDRLQAQLEKLDKYDRQGPPLIYRFGFYSGTPLYREKLLPIYYNAIEQRYRKPVMKRLEEDLKKFAESNPVANTTAPTEEEKNNLAIHYEKLKAYLMLSGKYQMRAHESTLVDVLAAYWKSESKIPVELHETAVNHLKFYAKQSDRFPDSPTISTSSDDPSLFPRFNLDEKNLVAEVRKKLKLFPASARYLREVITEINKKVPEVTAAGILSTRSEGVMEGKHSVKGAYTFEGYQHFKEALKVASVKLTEDDWVRDEKAEKGNTSEADEKWIKDTYLNTYADEWRKFVQEIKVNPYNRDTAGTSLAVFTTAESPMKILLKEVSRQTNLAVEPAPVGFINWIWSIFSSQKKDETKPETIVEKEFKSLHTFTDEKADKPGDSPISLYAADLKGISDELGTKKSDDIKELSLELANPKSTSPFVKLMQSTEKKLNSKLEGFKSSAGQDIATLLKRPFDNLKALFGADEESQLKSTWAEQILPESKKAIKGYPFDSTAEEANLGAVKDYLNPVDGKFAKFYKERLQKFFEESNGQLKPKESNQIKFSPEFVTYLNNVVRLQKALFGTGATPLFSYDFKLLIKDKPDGIIEVIIDGTPLSKETGSGTFKFPSTTNDTGVSMTFSATGEPTTPTNKPSPTPTPSANSTPATVTPSSTSTPASKPLPSSETTASSIRHQGTWGLFKFFDAGKPQKQASGEWLLTYPLGGKTLNATVKPAGGDLFERKIFTDAFKAPDNIFK